MNDFRSVLAMMPHEHCFAEPFIAGACDLRIQKIGAHYRAFRRIGVAGEWKTNTGTAVMEELPCEPRWKTWADAAVSAAHPQPRRKLISALPARPNWS